MGVDGTFISLSDIISEIFSEYGYSLDEASMFAGITVIFGVFSSMGVGILLQKTSKYLLMTRLSCVLTFLSIVVCAIVLPLGNFGISCIGVASLGTCLVPIIPCAMNFG